jgi:Zn-dependent peptidase ImmA (M78 family)
MEERLKIPAWDKTLRRLIDGADALGILVMVNGVVGNNSYRRLDPQEFRGFALADARAPLVFINGADVKAAQMFTLAHALAHIWLGQSALSDLTPITASEHGLERWCSAVAAEMLVPFDALRAEYRQDEELRNALTRLARRFKVSTLVIVRRIHDLGRLTHEEFRQAMSARWNGCGRSANPVAAIFIAPRACGSADALPAPWCSARSKGTPRIAMPSGFSGSLSSEPCVSSATGWG